MLVRICASLLAIGTAAAQLRPNEYKVCTTSIVDPLTREFADISNNIILINCVHPP